MCFRSNISETVEDIRVLFSLLARPRVMLPAGTNDVSVVNTVPEILKSSTSAFSNADLYEPCKHVQVVPNEVRERLNKEISQGYVLPVEYLRNYKRYSSSVFTLILGKSHATKRYKLRLRSFQHFRDIIVVNIKKWKFWRKIARAESYKPSNEFVRLNYTTS